jgi:LysM repeat protein
MSIKFTPKNVIKKSDKRQQMMPFFLGALAGFLALLGIFIIIMVVVGARNPFALMFATDTPTPTVTLTPSPSPLPTETPTITPTSGPTATETPAGPQQYMVKADDNCWSIASAFGVDLLVLLQANNFGNTCPIVPGQTIIIPAQDAQLPTETPIPTDLARGTIIVYTVKLGDTLQSIADKFNSTIESIKTLNTITDENSIKVGDQLKVRWLLATRTPTIAPTSTLGNLVTPLPSKTPTPKP